MDCVGDNRSFSLVSKLVDKEVGNIKRDNYSAPVERYTIQRVSRHEGRHANGKAFRKEVINNQLLGRDGDICP